MKAYTSKMNSWENSALDYYYPEQASDKPRGTTWEDPDRQHDPVIYPGLYCPSGVDIMSILFRVMSRPNPRVDLGAIDCGAAMLVCDLLKPDNPIVYASDAVFELTGYSRDEIMGRNCRFLQVAPGQKRSRSGGGGGSGGKGEAVRKMQQAVRSNQEVQVEVVNYQKSGDKFVNFLSIIPLLSASGDGYDLSIGFLGAKE